MFLVLLPCKADLFQNHFILRSLGKEAIRNEGITMGKSNGSSRVILKKEVVVVMSRAKLVMEQLGTFTLQNREKTNSDLKFYSMLPGKVLWLFMGQLHKLELSEIVVIQFR